MYDPDDAEEKTRVTEGFPVRPATSFNDAVVLIYPPGPEMGRMTELQGKVVNIGRDPANHIVVNSDSVSRHHARLTIEAAGRLITDLQSTNGTYVNNEPVLSRFLENGDLLKIGDSIFKYLVGSDVESAYHEEIYRMTIKDGLTEIYNKRFFLEALEREMARAQRYGRHLSILIFDIDYFKKVNDSYGHLAGDHVLQSLAQLISTRARREEIFARYGGEEFVVLLPETAKDGAVELAEQLRRRVEAHTFIFEGEEIPITISIGVATMGGDAESPTQHDFIKLADENLYRAKSEGRNCVRG